MMMLEMLYHKQPLWTILLALVVREVQQFEVDFLRKSVFQGISNQ